MSSEFEDWDAAQKQGHVYFLRGANEVKIGFSRNLPQRLEKLRNGNAFPVFICKIVAGTQATERRFHKQFAEYRIRGEWFDLRGRLAKYLERHVRPLPNLPPPDLRPPPNIVL
jgi:hypothetical protein